MKVIILTTLLAVGHHAIAQVRPYAPEIFPDKISGAVCGFSTNGMTIYFVREDTIKKKLFLFEADWNGKRWTNSRLMPFSGIHNDYGGRLTPDGSTFYFTSDRPGASDNKADVWNIWKAVKSSTGWKDPEPLHDISRRGDECCPTPIDNDVFLFSGTRGKDQWKIMKVDHSSTIQANLNIASAWQWPSFYDAPSKTLYFNSMNRPDSRGMDDIYVAEFDAGEWKNVRNLGDAVNTSQYEDGAILSPDRTLLIFCRHESGITPSRVLFVRVEDVINK